MLWQEQMQHEFFMLNNYEIYNMYTILLMEEILHQLVDSLSTINRVLYIAGGAGFLPSTVSLSWL